jgi:hypothetical protein
MNMKKIIYSLSLALLLLSCGNRSNNNQTIDDIGTSSSIDTMSDAEVNSTTDSNSDNETARLLSTAKNNPIDPVKNLYIYNKITPDIETLDRWLKKSEQYCTKRFNVYNNAYSLVGAIMIGGEGYVDNPVVQPVEGQDYIFKVSFTSCGNKENLYFLVALEDGEWRVDNLLERMSLNRWKPSIDYSQSLKDAWFEHYDYPDVEEMVSMLSKKEITDSKKVPDYVPDVKN